jgi:hypothetical protein
MSDKKVLVWVRTPLGATLMEETIKEEETVAAN